MYDFHYRTHQIARRKERFHRIFPIKDRGGPQ
jgi:hypothetical protein